MEELNIPKCSHDTDIVPQENSQPIELEVVNIIKPSVSNSFAATAYLLNKEESLTKIKKSNHSNSVSHPNYTKTLVKIKSSEDTPVTNQPRNSVLITPITLHTANQPISLFLQALSKLNESSNNFSIINYSPLNENRSVDWKSGDITPPNSLTSAPPSYSFVLRQIAARRRPRLVGTFIPSPSFVQHTPPPNYATAFDIYIDPGPPPPSRVRYNYGFTSIPVVCPECGYMGMTITTCKITICTHLCAFILCLFCCWICAPLPYVLRSCKDVYHYCRNCRNYLGMYCPTNPDNSISTRN